MRTESIQLPSYDELCSILSLEGSRQTPETKEHTHYTDFSSILTLLKEFKLSTKFFDSNFNFIDFKDPILFGEVSSMFNDLVNNILQTQNDNQKQKLYNNLYDYLSEKDEIQKADIIFVFGSKSTFRIEKAIKLYKDGYALKILLSGKGPFYENNKGEISEAEKLAKFAIEHGVPESALILEKESITMPDNVKRSLNILERESIPHASFILVNSPFSQRRGWAHFNKFTIENTKLMRCNTDTVSEQYSRNGWYRDEAGTKTIIKEFIALRISEILNTS
jgi:hypothetical protein